MIMELKPNNLNGEDTLLSLAVKNKNLKIVKMLLDNENIDPNVICILKLFNFSYNFQFYDSMEFKKSKIIYHILYYAFL